MSERCFGFPEVVRKKNSPLNEEIREIGSLYIFERRIS